jgi:hypothetical protein
VHLPTAGRVFVEDSFPLAPFPCPPRRERTRKRGQGACTAHHREERRGEEGRGEERRGEERRGEERREQHTQRPERT